MTFIEDGIPSIIKKTTLINFAKRAKTADVIRDIQQYQNVPYSLQPVPELQDYILSNMQAAGDVHEMYDKSLLVEPREREDEKIVRYVSIRKQHLNHRRAVLWDGLCEVAQSLSQRAGRKAHRKLVWDELFYPCLFTHLLTAASISLNDHVLTCL